MSGKLIPVTARPAYAHGLELSTSAGRSKTDNSLHDKWHKRLVEAYEELTNNGTKITFDALAKETGITRQSVRNMYAKYPMLFRNMTVERRHVAGK